MSNELLELDVIVEDRELPIYYYKMIPFVYREFGTNEIVVFNKKMRRLVSGNEAAPMVEFKRCLFPKKMDESIITEYAKETELSNIVEYFDYLNRSNIREEYISLLQSLHTDKKEKKLQRK